MSVLRDLQPVQRHDDPDIQAMATIDRMIVSNLQNLQLTHLARRQLIADQDFMTALVGAIKTRIGETNAAS